MKIATTSSSIGLFSLITMFVALHYFAVHKLAGSPTASIPLASLFFLALFSGSVSLALTLQGQDKFASISTASTVFLVGFGVTSALFAISLFGLPEDARQLPTNLPKDPIGAILAVLDQFRSALAVTHWWVHFTLGLALLTAVSTSVTLFVLTDAIGALHAAIAGPFYGLVLVAAILFAAYVFAILAAGAAMLAVAAATFALKVLAAE